jgi:hypothetical protein
LVVVASWENRGGRIRRGPENQRQLHEPAVFQDVDSRWEVESKLNAIWSQPEARSVIVRNVDPWKMGSTFRRKLQRSATLLAKLADSAGAVIGKNCC